MRRMSLIAEMTLIFPVLLRKHIWYHKQDSWGNEQQDSRQRVQCKCLCMCPRGVFGNWDYGVHTRWKYATNAVVNIVIKVNILLLHACYTTNGGYRWLFSTFVLPTSTAKVLVRSNVVNGSCVFTPVLYLLYSREGWCFASDGKKSLVCMTQGVG